MAPKKKPVTKKTETKSCACLNYLASFIATAGGIGKVKYAPGTFGSLFGLGLVYLLFYLDSTNVIEIDLVHIFYGLIALFFVGTWAAHRYESKKGGKDPKEVVIDEVVGQMMSVYLSFPFSFILYSYFSSKSMVIMETSMVPIFYGVLFFLIIPFVLFRLFDILKPWPLSIIDRDVKGGFGIMFDDVAAAFYALLAYLGIYYTISYFINLHA